MTAVWLVSVTLFIITLGFAALLGDIIFRLRKDMQMQLAGISLFLAGLVLSFPLSLPFLPSLLLWLAALAVIVVFARHRHLLPSRLLTRRFALRYAAAAMLFSAWWNIVTGPYLPAYGAAACALLAGLLALLESYNHNTFQG